MNERMNIFANNKADNRNYSIRKGWCGPCHHRCGVLVHLEDGRPVRVAGDPHHPMSYGLQCARGRLLLDHHNHPGRQNYPKKRVGGRGEGRWQRISWDQALDEIAARLIRQRQLHGPETLAFSHGTYRTYGWPVKRFMNGFGSPNIFGAVNVCRCPHWMVEWITYGANFLSDITYARCIVLWGRNSSETSIPEWAFVRAARKQRKSKLIVIDPRRTREAQSADLHMPIRPGSDLALMLGWLRLFIEEGLYDRDFVEHWTIGFNALRQRVEPYTLKAVADLTDLPVELIAEGARIYADHRPAAIPWGFGLDKGGPNAVQTARAHCILQAVMGNLDVKGGELLGRGETAIIPDTAMEANELLPAEKRLLQIGADRHRLQSYPGWQRVVEAWRKSNCPYTPAPAAEESACASGPLVLDAILSGAPYPVTALLCQASNPMLHMPNTRKVAAALTSPNLELSVVMDYYLTPTAMLADYVLPAADTLERADINDMHSYGFWAAANPRAVEPTAERRSDYFLWRELGLRLGQEELWPWATMEEALDHRLAPVGLNFEDLVDKYMVFTEQSYRKYKKHGFATPSGKVELASSIMAELGYDPLPDFRLAALDTITDFPLLLITGVRHQLLYHSEYRQMAEARVARPEPLAWLHPTTASEKGLDDGDRLRLTTRNGTISLTARLTEDIRLDCVAIEHGWWFPEEEARLPELGGVFTANANVLCPDDAQSVSPEMGTFQLTGIPCRIEREAPR